MMSGLIYQLHEAARTGGTRGEADIAGGHAIGGHRIGQAPGAGEGQRQIAIAKPAGDDEMLTTGEGDDLQFFHLINRIN